MKWRPMDVPVGIALPCSVLVCVHGFDGHLHFALLHFLCNCVQCPMCVAACKVFHLPIALVEPLLVCASPTSGSHGHFLAFPCLAVCMCADVHACGCAFPMQVCAVTTAQCCGRMCMCAAACNDFDGHLDFALLQNRRPSAARKKPERLQLQRHFASQRSEQELIVRVRCC